MQDIRDGLRALRASPAVSLVAVLSLALGIGANTAIFSLIDGLLLRSLPVRDPSRLVLLQQSGEQYSSWTNPIWEQVRSRTSPLFEGVTAWSEERFDLAQGGRAQFVDGLYASGSFFDVLGVPAIVGRTFTPKDDQRRGGPDGAVVVISHRFWQQHFGGAANAIGQPLTLNRVPFTVVGVMPRGFFGPAIGSAADVVIPLGTEPLLRGPESALDERGYWFLDIMARLKPGQTVEQATRAIEGIRPQIRSATLPTDWAPQYIREYLGKPFTMEAASGGTSFLRDRYTRPLLTVMVIVALVLLIACANIANLMLARAIARRHEMSVRLALGASRPRLARQLLAESVVLSMIGAGLGLLFAFWGSRLLVRQLSTSTSSVFVDLSIDWRVLAFTAALASLTAVLFGVAPALRAARTEPNDALKAQGRSVAGGRHALWRPLVIVQVALSLVLLVAAGLFLRTLSRLATMDLGFDRGPILVVNVDAAKSRVAPEERARLYARAVTSVSSVPGVAHAAASMVTPVSGMTWQNTVDVPGAPPMSDRERSTHVNFVTPGFFATYGTRLLAGRDFDNRDGAGAPFVVIVNETFARKFFSGRRPVGQAVLRRGVPGTHPPAMEVVGLVRDAVYRNLRQAIPPTMYIPLGQQTRTPPSFSISVRAAGGSPALLSRSVTDAITSVDRDLSLTFRTLSEQINASLIRERLIAMLSGFFGLLALLLAGIGLYGVTSYSVARQRTEIGIRMALGADPGSVARAVLKRVLVLVSVGVVAGSAVSLWASKFVSTLLYGLPRRDPATLVGAAAILATIGALSAWLPARRAARIDPATVLREG